MKDAGSSVRVLPTARGALQPCAPQAGQERHAHILPSSIVDGLGARRWAIYPLFTGVGGYLKLAIRSASKYIPCLDYRRSFGLGE